MYRFKFSFQFISTGTMNYSFTTLKAFQFCARIKWRLLRNNPLCLKPLSFYLMLDTFDELQTVSNFFKVCWESVEALRELLFSETRLLEGCVLLHFLFNLWHESYIVRLYYPVISILITNRRIMKIWKKKMPTEMNDSSKTKIRFLYAQNMHEQPIYALMI